MAEIRTLHGTLLLGKLPLGKDSDYPQTYTPSLLCSLSRSDGRAFLGLENNALPFEGVDIWTAYELSWLDMQGKPVVACGIFSIPCQSPGLIESKSLKLYLNSFNQTKFRSFDDVRKTITLDLSFAAQASVLVELHSVSDYESRHRSLAVFPGECLDGLPVRIDTYRVKAELLRCVEGSEEVVQESVYSHLLRSNCPVTGQPDWGSIHITYRGPRIDRESVLRYLCSYRQEADFHEQCAERIFRDLLEQCGCERLTVEVRYLRRGGLDINPFRTNCGAQPMGLRLARQ